MSKVEITPGGSDFRLMDKVAVEAFRCYRERARFIRGLVNTLGFKVATFEFTAPPRFAGHSKYNLRKMLHFALDGITSFSNLPLRWAFYIGMVFGFVDLKMPDDVFRITSQGIEFIDMASNSVNAEKSLLFTEAMTKKNFRFPAIEIAGNPTVKKEYDEGYLLLDADRRLFHLKQVKGRPYVRAITLPEGLTLEHLYLTEFRNKKTLAFLTDINNALYVLKSRTYDVVKTGVPAFNPETDALTIIGNMFDWTVRVTSPSSDNYYALNADDYSLIKKLENNSNTHYMPGISFTSYTDKYVMPRFE